MLLNISQNHYYRRRVTVVRYVAVWPSNFVVACMLPPYTCLWQGSMLINISTINGTIHSSVGAHVYSNAQHYCWLSPGANNSSGYLAVQVGSLVPADSASMHVLDAVHTRMGASDNLAMGSSTFLEASLA